MTTPPPAPEDLNQALRLVASRQLAATSALQRWMHITFARATNLLNELEQQGYVGPADGSKSREVHVQCCEQCGRIGKRLFETIAAPGAQPITVCTAKTACRKRWPKPPRDDA